ncbi:hypothetical protein [Sphingobium indicum]|nr:hypothetical protein [Sphingobium indicum]
MPRELRTQGLHSPGAGGILEGHDGMLYDVQMTDVSAPQEDFDVYLDPPGGHAWGFPKKFDPSFGDDVNGWLLANGYPEAEIAQWPDRRVPCWSKRVRKEGSEANGL